MVTYVVDAVREIQPRRMIAVTDTADDEVAKELTDHGVEIVPTARRIAADPSFAVLAGLAAWADVDLDLDLDPDRDDVLVVPAEVPLLRPDSLAALLARHRAENASATVLGGDEAGPSSVWVVRRSLLAPALRRAAAPGIAALGDVLEETGHAVARCEIGDAAEVRPVTDRRELARAEAAMRDRINDGWLARGVTMVDPERTYLDATVTLARDVTLFPGVILAGSTTVGEGCEIGPGCRLTDTVVGAGCRLEQVTADLATVGEQSRVGPYAVLEPGAAIPAATATGPFYTAGPDGP